MAIVALFAMSASAFAAPAKAKVTALASYGTKADQNNGAVTGTVASKDLATSVYYYGDLTTEQAKIGMKVTTVDPTTTTQEFKFGGFVNGETTEWIDFTESITASTPYDADANFAAVDLDGLEVISGIAVYENADDPDALADDGVALSVDLKPIDIAISADSVYAGSTGENQTLALKGDGFSLKLKDAGELECLSKDAMPKGIFAVVSGDAIVVSSDKTAAEGKYVLVYKMAQTTPDITVSEDKGLAGIKVVGLTQDEDLVTIQYTVLPNPADELLKEIVASADLKAELKAGPNVVLTNAAGKAVDVNASDLGVVSADKSITFTIISVDMTGATSIDANIAPADALVFRGDHEDGEKESDAIKISGVMNGSSVEYEIDLLKLFPVRGAMVDAPVKGHLDIPSYGITGKSFTAITSVESTDTSSGGACDMGLGLAAAALAIVALRKRSK